MFILFLFAIIKLGDFMKKNDYLFLIVFALIIVFGSLTFFRPQKEKSNLENRLLTKFPSLTISNYLDGSFQDDIENAFTDQFWGSGTIKKHYNGLFDLSNIINKHKDICSNNYYNIGQRGIYNCEDYMVLYKPYLEEDYVTQPIETIKSISIINSLADTYYYFINTSRVYDFKKDDYIFVFKDLFKENMTGNYHYSEFVFNDYEDYKNYFYKTDHHWNHKGSYKGYTEIMNMFNIKNIIKPIEEVTFKGLYFYGSHATISRKYDIHEDLTVYRFNIPSYVSYINGEEKNYGKEDKFFNNEFNEKKHSGLYGEFYGGDHAEVIFDFHNKNKDNLLIIGNSYTNAVNKLIASHFNKTYVIDFRHYEEKMGQEFDAEKYIKDNNINKVLVLSDLSFYLAEDFELDWGDE